MREATLPPLLEIDPEGLNIAVVDDPADEEECEEEDEGTAIEGLARRFRDEMLGDDERGLSVSEICELVELEESTVRSYLSSEERRRGIGNRIRADERLRTKALSIVAKKRA